MINDTISDLLTRIRNANLAKHRKVVIFNTKMNYEICKILKKEGFIKDFTGNLTKDSQSTLWTKGPLAQQRLVLTLKYSGPKQIPCITNLKRLSCSSLRFYSGYKDIPRLLNGMGVIIMTTSKGIMTDRDARKLKIGGEVICSVW